MAQQDIDTDYGIFLAKLPLMPHKEGLTRDEAQDFLDAWEADGGWRESWLLGRQVDGRWRIIPQQPEGTLCSKCYATTAQCPWGTKLCPRGLGPPPDERY